MTLTPLFGGGGGPVMLFDPLLPHDIAVAAIPMITT